MSKGANTLLTILLVVAAGILGGFVSGEFRDKRAPSRAAPRGGSMAVEAIEELREELRGELRDLGRRMEAVERSRRSEVEGAAARPEELRYGSDPVARGEQAVPESAEGTLAWEPGKSFGYAEAQTLMDDARESPGRIDGLVASIRAAIARDPENADLRCALATALNSKAIFGMTPGPEQWKVFGEASESYKEAIRLDPGHWQARFGKANGESMAPEFVGLRPQAIRQFEELMKIQESRAPAEEQALVYRRLGSLYRDAGNTVKARQIWERGRKRHPQDEGLKEALDILGER
jgi:tetratricopeptide (TPR) repeat protein